MALMIHSRCKYVKLEGDKLSKCSRTTLGQDYCPEHQRLFEEMDVDVNLIANEVEQRIREKK